MSVRPDPVIPETRRRRASTTEKSERILKMSRSLTLTRSVLAGTLAEATPNQLDFIERWFTAELDSRERSKRLRLLKQAGFPADKTLDGYDWTNLKMPADWGRAQLENLDFVAGCEDLVLYGPVGTGKSHLAIAIGRLACERGVPVRFFTATGLLMRLRRAQQENRLDRELASIGKARLLIIDEFGYLPIETGFGDLAQEDLDAIVGEINDTPMKLLGYKTPNEVWDEEIAKLQSKAASPNTSVALTN